MHVPRPADDGVYRTCLYAQGAANAKCLVNLRSTQWLLRAKVRIEWFVGFMQKRRKFSNARVSAGRALIQVSNISGERLCIRPAAGVAAFGALRLRENRINAGA